MVHREDSEGLIVISQPAHAWVAGQLARHWGNARFGTFAPHEEICLGAEQHDIGFLDWEKAPTLHRPTGRPHQFTNLPTRPHLALWTAGVEKLLAYSRYAALLTSRHVQHLCENNKVTRLRRDAGVLQDFLEQQRALQSRLIAGLRRDPAYRPAVQPNVLERHARLLATWDWLSLVFCMGLTEPQTVEHVPAAGKPVTLSLRPDRSNPGAVAVSPWPFRSHHVTLVCDGRRLPATFTREPALRRAMRQAPVVAVRTRLVPRPG